MPRTAVSDVHAKVVGRELRETRRVLGLTQAEVAQRMGIAIGTVKSRMFRAHRRLAGLLGHLRDEAEPPPAGGRKRLTEEPPR